MNAGQDMVLEELYIFVLILLQIVFWMSLTALIASFLSSPACQITVPPVSIGAKTITLYSFASNGFLRERNGLLYAVNNKSEIITKEIFSNPNITTLKINDKYICYHNKSYRLKNTKDESCLLEEQTYKGFTRFRSLSNNKRFLMINRHGELRTQKVENHRTMWFKLNPTKETFSSHKYMKQEYKKVKRELLALQFPVKYIKGRLCKTVPNKILVALKAIAYDP
ncbi:uncharacterized protein [Clytia hemisphaerica]|uniref:FGF n=1 Tax=Clytia hemisphaerica TaxID=252671 RepID=A0A7M5V562_9CNID